GRRRTNCSPLRRAGYFAADRLFGEPARRFGQTIGRERIHAILDERADHRVRLRPAPLRARRRVEPDDLAEMRGEAAEPGLARFAGARHIVDRTARCGDFVGSHRRIADEDDFVVGVVAAQELRRGDAFARTQPVVAPQRGVDEIVEIVVLETLEFALRRAEQRFADGDVIVHRTADVEQQQDLHRVVAFGTQADVEHRLARGRIDRAFEVEFLGCAFAREASQAPQCELEIARREIAVAVEPAIIALLPHLHRTATAAARTDADAHRIRAAGAERARAARADPLAAAGMALLLFG